MRQARVFAQVETRSDGLDWRGVPIERLENIAVIGGSRRCLRPMRKGLGCHCRRYRQLCCRYQMQSEQVRKKM